MHPPPDPNQPMPCKRAAPRRTRPKTVRPKWPSVKNPAISDIGPLEMGVSRKGAPQKGSPKIRAVLILPPRPLQKMRNMPSSDRFPSKPTGQKHDNQMDFLSYPKRQISALHCRGFCSRDLHPSEGLLGSWQSYSRLSKRMKGYSLWLQTLRKPTSDGFAKGVQTASLQRNA